MERPATAQIDAVQHYLAREFPGQKKRTWWDTHLMVQVFEIAYGSRRHHLVVDWTFFQACPEYIARLRDSDLTDYIRETLSPGRCFLVMWHDGAMHIRSKRL